VSEPTCLVVMYHYVRDSAATAFPEIRALAPQLFEQQLDWLQTRYAVIDLARLEAALNGEEPLPPDAVLLTFDDGLIDHYDTVLPLLRARGLRGTFFLAHNASGESPRLLAVHKVHFLLAHMGAEAFGPAVLEACDAVSARRVPSRQVLGADRWEEADIRAIKHLVSHELPFADAERGLEELFARHIGDSAAFAKRLYLSAAMIHEMAAAGMTFGYHTRTHRMLARLSPDEQQQELHAGVEWIRALTGQTTVPFCYPWGGPHTYTRDTLRILRHSGYSLAFNTVRRRLTLDDNRYELPRIDTRDLPPYTTAEPPPAPAFSAEEA
jgi:peptidoglycan/xylan/chitin deacetylase (PgdA/CDA1 family)